MEQLHEGHLLTTMGGGGGGGGGGAGVGGGVYEYGWRRLMWGGWLGA